MMSWKKFESEKPTKPGTYLACFGSNIFLADYSMPISKNTDGIWHHHWLNSSFEQEVTYWMEIPKPPL